MKKSLGLGLATAVTIASFSTPELISAEESTEIANTKAKIAHIIYSINENYAGIKNQITWENYIKEARELLKKIPSTEVEEIENLTRQVDGFERTVLAIARINKVEKSYEENHTGIKNVPQWKDYLELAKKDMTEIDKSVFEKKYEELAQRYTTIETKVQEIEEEHIEKLKEIEEQYNEAKKSLKIEKIEKVLEEANKLGDHNTTTELINKIEEFLSVLKSEAQITEVTAIDTKNIEIKGKALHNIKAEDIKVEYNSIESIKLNEELNSIEVKLKDSLAPNHETPIKIKVNGVEEEFKVTADLNITEKSKIEIESKTYGHDRVGQKIEFSIDGKAVDVNYLKNLGYEISFIATRPFGGAANIFEGETNVSKTGILSPNIPLETNGTAIGLKGVNKIEVQLIKNGSMLTSEVAEINIVNLSEVTTAITAVEIHNEQGKFKMNSQTLVSGEKASVQKVTSTLNGVSTTALEKNIKIQSSNSKIISVNGLILTAQGPGEATITIKVGDIEKKIDMKVTSEKRVLDKVTLDKQELTLVANKNNTLTEATNLKMKTLDQYGDPISVDGTLGNQVGISGDIVEGNPPKVTNNGNLLLDNTIKTNSSGEINLTLKPNIDSGSGNIYFLNKYKNQGVASNNVLATLKVNITRNNIPAKYELAVNSGSLPQNIGKTADLKLNIYNSDGILLGSENDLSKYEIKSLDTGIATITNPSPGGNTVKVTAVGLGGVDIVLTKESKTLAKVTMNVVPSSQTEITNITFKPQINEVTGYGNRVYLKDVIDVVETANDPIIKGITLSNNSTQTVRILKDISSASGISIGKNSLYIDKDNNGKYDPSDEIIGYIEAEGINDIDSPNDLNTLINNSNFADFIIETPTNGNSKSLVKGTVLVKILNVDVSDKTKGDPSKTIGVTQFKVNIR